MFGYISGLIIDKDEKSLLVLTGGIGYRVFSTIDLVAQTKIDQKVQLYIHTAVREDDISLYGFPGKEELKFYQQLLAVSGIGPKMAMDILATPINITKNAIIAHDIPMLTKIKGLGKKTAERLCLELQNKLDLVLSGAGGSPAKTGVHEEAASALESLGYERFQVLKFMANLPTDINETEEIVKYFLKSSH